MTNTIYIGSRLPNSEVRTNELFTTRPTELIERLKPKYPLIDLLFVPCDEYTQALCEIDTAGSLRSKAYKQTKGGGING